MLRRSMAGEDRERFRWTLVVAALVLFLLVSVRQLARAEVPGAVGRWSLDETTGSIAPDTSGMGHTGQLIGSPLWIEGHVGGALSFDGLDDHVTILPSPGLDASTWTGLTLSLWVRPQRLDHLGDQTLYGHWGASHQMRPLQLLLGPDNHWQCILDNQAGSVESRTPAELDVWTHLTVVWTPVSLRLYVDGIPQATDLSVPQSLPFLDHAHSLGARDKSGTVDQHFHGALDEVMLFDRALTDEEIESLAGIVDPGPPPLLWNEGPTGVLPHGTTSMTLTVYSDRPATLFFSEEPGVPIEAMERVFAGVAEIPGERYFPPPGNHPDQHQWRLPQELGLDPQVIPALQQTIVAGHWALWRDGYLVHTEGDFTHNVNIFSARKTFHAATVGAAIQLGLVTGLDEPLAIWSPELTGKDADVTWHQVLAQTSAFDEPLLDPGSLWAYSDANAFELNLALARAFGRDDLDDDYELVIGPAFLDPIGAVGWTTEVEPDGIRLNVDLDHLGRFGQLLVSDGVWDGQRLLARGYGADMATKQTYGLLPNYENDNDGHTEMTLEDFPESPYGFMSWVNTDQDLWPEAASAWGAGIGVFGNYFAWNADSGVVLAILEGELVEMPGNPPGWPTPLRPALAAIDPHVISPNLALGYSIHTAEVSGLEDGGTYSYYVRAVSETGVVLPEELEITFSVEETPDTTPPALGVFRPRDGDAIQGTIPVWLQASDDDAIQEVRVSVDGEPITTLDRAPYAFPWDTVPVADGDHLLHFEAEDPSGNVTEVDVAVFIQNQPAFSPHSAGLQCHWPLDEELFVGFLKDTSGHGHDAWPVGPIAFTDAVQGSGVTLAGADAALRIADDASLELSTWTGLTVTLWVRPEVVDAGDEQTLVGHWAVSRKERPFQLLLNRENRWECRTNFEDGLVVSPDPTTPGEWTHLAAVWSPAGLQLHVDGALVAEDLSVAAWLDACGGAFTLGAREKGGKLSQFLTGSLDDVAIFDRALTPEEILQVMVDGL